MDSAPKRRPYLDWLRGIAVLIMVESHTLDSWTQVADRGRAAYQWAMTVAGFGAPIFLFLAGVATALAAGARMRQGLTERQVAALAFRRGWQIFGLAFLFRLQSWIISGGPPQSLLKVDILNVMGVSLVAGALLWAIGWGPWSRALLLAGGAGAAAMLTPIIRASEVLSPLPDPIEWYLRPVPGRTTFTLFPWGGFLLAGAAIGLWLDAARTQRQERVANAALLAVGSAMAALAYGASFLPAIYGQTSFWTSSPTFFFVRLGVVVLMLPLAYAWNAGASRGVASHSVQSPLAALGASSLFVYWIHVEMVYGVLSAPLHRRMPLEQAFLAFALFSGFLFLLVKLKRRLALRLAVPV